MNRKPKNTFKQIAENSVHFFAPKKETVELNSKNIANKVSAILIPTHTPSEMTHSLIKSVVEWHPEALLVVIDDCTPQTEKNLKLLNKIKALADTHTNMTYLRTPKNELKAAALNYGIDYLLNLPTKPDVIFTFDDDVIITKDTVKQMVATLYSDDTVGAVCSEVRVINKNKNFLTRLQALEYHNFNITKIADNGFLKGPLVMHGMLTAFRTTAMEEINGFTKGHLIEDYDITARLKSEGWNVKIAQKAIAWTTVPESIEALWKQRVRWVSGGLHVLGEFWKKFEVVYQDLVGHMLFISLFGLIVLSFFFVRSESSDPQTVLLLFALSLFNFFVAFIFNIVSLTLYEDGDKRDWFMKLTIVPELIYSNLLSLILIGSYLFILYTKIFKPLANAVGIFKAPYNLGLAVFNKAGFSTTWGTKNS